MKTNKIIVDVKIEVLSIDAVPARLAEVARRIGEEQIAGNLRQEDGDESTWDTTITPVEF